MTRILAGFDGSDPARAAIAVAGGLFGGAQTIVATVHPPPPTLEAGALARAALPDAMIREGIERMRVALRLWIARGDYLAAYDLACRLSLRDPALVRDVPGIDRLPLMLVMQKLARFANAIGGVDRLELVGVEQAAEVMALLRQAGLETRIALNAGSAPPVDAPRETTIVYLAQEAGRGACGSLGYVPNLVVSEAELLSGLYAP